MNETALIEVLRSSADFSSVSERSLGELARSGTVRRVRQIGSIGVLLPQKGVLINCGSLDRLQRHRSH